MVFVSLAIPADCRLCRATGLATQRNCDEMNSNFHILCCGGGAASWPRSRGRLARCGGGGGGAPGLSSNLLLTTSPPADLARGCSAAPRKLRLVGGLR